MHSEGSKPQATSHGDSSGRGGWGEKGGKGYIEGAWKIGEEKLGERFGSKGG